MLITRLAPTPSGYLHLGNTFSFALTAAIAAEAGAKILLRIDDLDRGRAGKQYIQDIFDTISFLGIPYHIGPQNSMEFETEWSQIHRMPLYSAAVDQLIKKNLVFACECSRTDIAQDSKDGGYPGTCLHKNLPPDTPGTALRLITPDNKLTRVKQYQEGIALVPFPLTMRNFIVRKKDGFPAYQLTSLVDDVHFGVNIIVRGTDLLPSTIAQLYLAELLDYTGFARTEFRHHPVLTDPAGEKLSKSAGATSIAYLRHQGKNKADIFTAIAEMPGYDHQ